MIFDKLITDEEQVIQLVSESIERETGCLITYFNQHCFNIYSSESDYKNLIDKNFTTYIDGTGLRIALRLCGYKISSTFNASDLNEKLFNYFIDKNCSAYLVGGKIPENIITDENSNKLKPAGYLQGFFKPEEEESIIQKIIDNEPDIIIVGMGVPRQEQFSIKLANKMKGARIICVGNFLEFYFGTVKRIPKMFRNSGFEWIYRLISEPERLWKRYLLGIPKFFFLLIKKCFSINKQQIQ